MSGRVKYGVPNHPYNGIAIIVTANYKKCIFTDKIRDICVIFKLLRANDQNQKKSHHILNYVKIRKQNFHDDSLFSAITHISSISLAAVEHFSVIFDLTFLLFMLISRAAHVDSSSDHTLVRQVSHTHRSTGPNLNPVLSLHSICTRTSEFPSKKFQLECPQKSEFLTGMSENPHYP